jgi:photosystem II stability/assembly factor-like uncharacterized protein
MSIDTGGMPASGSIKFFPPKLVKTPSLCSPRTPGSWPVVLAVSGWSFFQALPAAQPPQGKAATRTTQEDVAYRLVPEDFGFSDPLDVPPDQFTAVRVASVPSAGTLLIDGVLAGVGSLLEFEPWPGRDWEPSETARSWGSLACSNDGTTVVAGTLYGGLIHISRDGGATWTTRDPSGNGGGNWYDVAVSSDGTRLVYASASDNLWVSTDAGLTWAARGPSAAWMGIAGSSDGQRLAALPSYGNIHVSDDGGVTWNPRGEYFPVWSDVATSANGMRIVASQWDGVLAISGDGGATWDLREPARSWTAVASSADGLKLAATVRDGQIWLSDDGGLSWRPTGESSRWADITTSADGEFLAAVGSGGMIHTSFNRGRNWVPRVASRASGLALAGESRELWAYEFDGRLHRSAPQPAEMVFQPAPEASGRPYASFGFQVVDSGPDGFNVDPSPKVFGFDVTPVEDQPVVAVPLPDQAAAIGQPFRYAMAPGSFTDTDPNPALGFSAVRADGGPLPGWLMFDPATQTFSGLPAAADRGRTEIRVTATDLTGLSASDTFGLAVAGLPQGAASSLTLDEETSRAITGADFPFADPFDVPPDSVTRVRLTTVPALGVLRLNDNLMQVGDFVPLVPTPGVSWTRRSTLASCVLAASADASRLLAVRTPLEGYAVYRSANGGQTWTPVTFFGSHLARPTCAAASADGMRWVVAAREGGRIHTSSDYGQTWVSRESARNWSALACSADGSRILAVDFGGGGGLPYISTDFGVTWKWRSTVFRNWVAAAASADGMKLVIASRSQGILGIILTSDDGGDTWSMRSPSGDWSCLASSADGERLAAGSNQGLFLSDDAGATWRQVLAGINLTSVSNSHDGQILAATATGGRIHVSLDRGATWAAGGATADWSSVVSTSDGRNMVGAGSGGIFTSAPAIPPLVYTPPENGAGTPYTSFTFQVEDSGPSGLNLDPEPRAFAIHVINSNDPPVAAELLPAQLVPPSASLDYQISATAFTDPDPGDRLDFAAALENGEPLPSWLHFEASTRTLSAAAEAVVPGTYQLRITASDQGTPPERAHALLRLTFLGHPPVGGDTTVTMTEDGEHRFTPADFRFSDPSDTRPDSFSRILLESIPVKGALTIEGIALGAGEYVSMVPDARMVWTQQGTRKEWHDLAMSADGSRLAAVWGSSGAEAVAGEIVLSADGGATWTAAQPGTYWRHVAMSPDGTRLVAAAQDNRLAISQDSGQSWTRRGPTEDWISVAISQDGSRILATPYSGPLHVSHNGGVTWATQERRIWRKVAMSDDGSVMAAAGSGFLVSLDGGVTWTRRDVEGDWTLLVLSRDGKHMAGARGEQFLYSDDQGVTWETRGSSLSCRRLAGSADLSRLVAADRLTGRLHVSSDAGHTWTPKERRNSWAGLASSDDGSRLAAVSSPGFVFTSVDAVPELVFKPAANAAGPGYAQWSFRVGDSGTPGSNLAATASVMRVDVLPVNDPPVVAIPIPDRTATEHATFFYAFPLGTFSDPEDGGALTYEATLASGAPLPGWLQFNPANRSFTGKPGPPDTGVLEIAVTASDSAVPRLSVTDTFRLLVQNVDEPPSGTSVTLTLNEDVPWLFTPADFGFSDPADVPPGAFSRVKVTTLPAAGGLAVDGVPAVPGASVRLAPSVPGAVWSPQGVAGSWWAVCSSADGMRLATVLNGARIYTSADAGVTWTPRESNRYWYAIASSADGQRLAAMVQGGLIYTSADAGATWVPQATARSWRAIASSADGSRLVALDSPGQIHVSSDFGATWTPRESSRAWYSIASSADGLKLAAVVQNGTIFTSDDGGEQWVPAKAPATGAPSLPPPMAGGWPPSSRTA